MMRQIPGAGAVNESDAVSAQIPGAGFLTVSAGPPDPPGPFPPTQGHLWPRDHLLISSPPTQGHLWPRNA